MQPKPSTRIWPCIPSFVFRFSPPQFSHHFRHSPQLPSRLQPRLPSKKPTTSQGIAFAVVRISLGIFSFFVPLLTATGFTTLAWILTGFLVVSGVIGIAWAPRNEGKSLDQLEAERGAG